MAYGGPASITGTLRRDSKDTNVHCIFRTYSEGLRSTHVANGLRRPTLAIVPSKATEQQQRDMRPSTREASTRTSSCLLAQHLRKPSQVARSVGPHTHFTRKLPAACICYGDIYKHE